MDARYEHVRVAGRVISQGMLLVSGLRGDAGTREILGLAVEDTESVATDQTLFRGLKAAVAPALYNSGEHSMDAAAEDPALSHPSLSGWPA